MNKKKFTHRASAIEHTSPYWPLPTELGKLSLYDGKTLGMTTHNLREHSTVTRCGEKNVLHHLFI